MNIAVVGSRTFTDYFLLEDVLNEHTTSLDTLVSGGAAGADTLAEHYAKDYGLKMIVHKPEWKKYGRAAGFIRNQLIVDDADILIAFWDGKSKGTQHSINLAKQKGIKVIIT
jgi:hypothetical protein